MTFLLAFWKPIAIVVGLVVLMIAVVAWKHSYDEGKRDEGRVEVQTQWDAAKAAAIKARNEEEERWQGEVAAREKAEKERDDERAKRTEVAALAAKRLPVAVSRAPVGAAAVAVLRDAVTGSNSASTSTIAGKPVEAAPAAATDSDVGTITRWGVEVIAVCTEYRDRALGLIAFYNSLRASQAGAEDAQTSTAP